MDIVSKFLKLGVPLLLILAIGVFGWLYIESTNNQDNAQRAADTVLDAANSAYDAATSGSRYRTEEELNYVSIGAIYTSTGNVKATLIVRGSDGVEAVCNRLAHVRDYLVVLLSDYPPDPRHLHDGPVGYPGSIVASINKLIAQPVVAEIRFDPFQLGSSGARANC